MQQSGSPPPLGYAPGPPPIMQQPGVGLQWAPAPSNHIPDAPPGLEYLGLVDQILIKQKVKLAEVLLQWESNNKYVIMVFKYARYYLILIRFTRTCHDFLSVQFQNSMGQQIYNAVERTGCLMRWFCGAKRGFEIFIEDNTGKEVMRVVREFKCCAGCCWCANCNCCAYEIRVEAPPGNVIGYTRQMQSCCRIILDIQDEHAQTVLKIPGPVCSCGFGDVEFPVLTADESQTVGAVTKQWSGFLKEVFTDADNFSISFPMDLSIKMKDFMAFEQKRRSGQNSGDAIGGILNIFSG